MIRRQSLGLCALLGGLVLAVSPAAAQPEPTPMAPHCRAAAPAPTPGQVQGIQKCKVQPPGCPIADYVAVTTGAPPACGCTCRPKTPMERMPSAPGAVPSASPPARPPG